jgi:hypothetical protein
MKVSSVLQNNIQYYMKSHTRCGFKTFSAFSLGNKIYLPRVFFRFKSSIKNNLKKEEGYFTIYYFGIELGHFASFRR